MGSQFFKADHAMKVPPAARTGFRTLGNGPTAVQTTVPFGPGMSDPGLMMSSSPQAWATAVPQFASNGQMMPFAPVAATYVPVTSPGWMPNPYVSQAALGMGMPLSPFAMPPFSQPMYPMNNPPAAMMPMAGGAYAPAPPNLPFGNAPYPPASQGYQNTNAYAHGAAHPH